MKRRVTHRGRHAIDQRETLTDQREPLEVETSEKLAPTWSVQVFGVLYVVGLVKGSSGELRG